MKMLAMKLLQPLLRNYSYTVRNGIAKGLKRRGGLGFFPRLTETGIEEKFFKSLCLDGRSVYDIGGYIGITTLFFARAVGERGRVVTFEPNSDNYTRILENVRLNNFGKRVKVFNIGLSSRRERTRLFIDRNGDTGTGSILDETETRRGNNKSLVPLDIEVDTLDSVVQGRNLPGPDFVKIDVEGHEMNVLLGMRRTMAEHKPALYIEIHGSDLQGKTRNIREVTDYVLARGYSIRHVESGSQIDRSNSEAAIRGHIYCFVGAEVLLRTAPTVMAARTSSDPRRC